MKFLEKQQSELELCEKALADYMESKRRKFPRFYFVSTADLLDILSNGNNPVKVCTNGGFVVHWGMHGFRQGVVTMVDLPTPGDVAHVQVLSSN